MLTKATKDTKNYKRKSKMNKQSNTNSGKTSQRGNFFYFYKSLIDNKASDEAKNPFLDNVDDNDEAHNPFLSNGNVADDADE